MSDVKELNINNTTYDIKAKTVVDQNGGSLKYWTGTKAQYDAIVSKDANTLYSITDDTSPATDLYSILELMYPIGSIYIGTMATCPIETLGIGTWQLKTSRFLVDKYENGTDWWELYSDGWCRQGGLQTGTGSYSHKQVTLFKEYADTNYKIYGTHIMWSSENNTWYTNSTTTVSMAGAVDIIGIPSEYGNKTTSSFYMESYSLHSWITEGYTSTITQFNQWERIA